MHHYLVPFVIFIVGVCVSFITTTSGGGALITIPVFILLGFPAQTAIATVKVGTIGTMLSGLYTFQRHKMVDYKIGFPAALLGILGSIVGAFILIHIPSIILKKLVGIFTIILLGIALLSEAGIKKPAKPNQFQQILGVSLFFFIGLWGGLFAGQGIFATYVLVFLFSKSFLEAAGTRKITGLAIGLTSIFVYALGDIVDWFHGGILFSATLIGSHLGSNYGIVKGDKWVRRFFLFMVGLLALSLLVAKD